MSLARLCVSLSGTPRHSRVRRRPLESSGCHASSFRVFLVSFDGFSASGDASRSRGSIDPQFHTRSTSVDRRPTATRTCTPRGPAALCVCGATLASRLECAPVPCTLLPGRLPRLGPLRSGSARLRGLLVLRGRAAVLNEEIRCTYTDSESLSLSTPEPLSPNLSHNRTDALIFRQAHTAPRCVRRASCSWARLLVRADG